MDGQKYVNQVSLVPSSNYIEIEPVTGTMTKMKRSYTVVYTITCYDTQTYQCKTYSQLPFPDLDPFKNKQFPVYNITEEITIDPKTFTQSVRYITNEHSRIYSYSLVLCIITFSCLTLACCFWSIFWINEPVVKPVDIRQKKVEDAEKKTEFENFDQPFFQL